jgi:hypothetical protein
MSKNTTEGNLKKTIKAQIKELGININFDPKPELKTGLYRKGALLNEGQLKKLVGKSVPVWASIGVYLEDGSPFALGFEFTGDDYAPCQGGSIYGNDDEDSMAVFEAIPKKQKGKK